MKVKIMKIEPKVLWSMIGSEKKQIYDICNLISKDSVLSTYRIKFRMFGGEFTVTSEKIGRQLQQALKACGIDHVYYQDENGTCHL